MKVVDERVAAHHARNHVHVVVDTQARPTEEDLRALAEGADLMVLPTTPDALALEALRGSEARFRVLLTLVPPPPSRDGEEARALLRAERVPLFEGWVRRAAAFPKAALLGVPVYRAPDPRARLAWGGLRAGRGRAPEGGGGMSKFARLLKEVKEKEEASGERPRGKSRREDYVAMKVYISKELHRRLKLKALEEEKELSELVEEALRKLLV